MAVDWMSVEADWSLILALILLWYIVLKNWERRGVLDRWNATRVFGVILMIRSNKGLDALEKISKPRKFWRAYGEVSLWVCYLAMAAVAFVVILAFISAILSPPTQEAPSPSELVALPGLNPMIPLGWGAIAFISALVIHELGHGILARAHGMRVRSFGLLQLGPLPLGAFAEPQHQELLRAPRRERMRMFAAGPATNIFAAFVLMLLMGVLASQFTTVDSHVHVRGIIKDGGADEAGMEPWDTIVAINGSTIEGTDGFREVLSQYSSGDSIEMEIIRDGESQLLNANLTDKHQYYVDLGWSNESLASIGIEPGDAFLGVEGLSEGYAGIDRLAGPFSPRFEGGFLLKALSVPIHAIGIMLIPFQLNGVAIHPFEEALLIPGDGILASTLGLGGLFFLAHLFFWCMWVNILLGFTNLIPMVPFDGGHMFRDIVNSWLSGLRKVLNKLKIGNIHPLWVEHISSKASSLSSLMLLGVLLFIMVIPYI